MKVNHNTIYDNSVQFSSVTLLCPTLCNFMDCSMPGFPVIHCLLEFAQIHVHNNICTKNNNNNNKEYCENMWKLKATECFWVIPFLLARVQLVQSLSRVRLKPHGLQHPRLPCPLPTPRAYSNSCPSSRWCHPTISSSVVSFFSCLQSFPAPGSFPMSQLFASDGQSMAASASASVFSMNIQDWFPIGLTGLISLQSKGLWVIR